MPARTPERLPGLQPVTEEVTFLIHGKHSFPKQYREQLRRKVAPDEIERLLNTLTRLAIAKPDIESEEK